MVDPCEMYLRGRASVYSAMGRQINPLWWTRVRCRASVYGAMGRRINPLWWIRVRCTSVAERPFIVRWVVGSIPYGGSV